MHPNTSADPLRKCSPDFADLLNFTFPRFFATSPQIFYSTNMLFPLALCVAECSPDFADLFNFTFTRFPVTGSQILFPCSVLIKYVFLGSANEWHKQFTTCHCPNCKELYGNKQCHAGTINLDDTFMLREDFSCINLMSYPLSPHYRSELIKQGSLKTTSNVYHSQIISNFCPIFYKYVSYSITDWDKRHK